MVSSSTETPTVVHLLRILKRLSRLFRAKRLTTLAIIIDSLLIDSLCEVNDNVHNTDLARDEKLEDIYEQSRLVELFHDMALENDFFMESREYTSHVLGGIMLIATLSTDNKFRTTAKRLMLRAPALWKQIWDNRSHVALSQAPTDSYGMPDNFMSLIVTYGPTALYSMRDKECPDIPYLQHVSLYVLLSMTIHIDSSTSEGDALVAMFVPLLHGDSISADVLVREVFAPGSGIEVDTLFLRFNQQLKRISDGFNSAVPEHTETLSTHIDALALLRQLVCQPLTLPLIGQRGCHRAMTSVLRRVVRGDISSDNAPNAFMLWCISEEMYLDMSHHIELSPSSWSVALQELLHSEDIVERLALCVELVAAYGLTLAAKPARRPLARLALSIRDLRELLSVARCDPVTKPFRISAEHALRAQWWPSLSSLQKAAYRTSSGADRAIYKDITLEWMELGHDAGLDGKKERKRHEREAAQRCSWSACVWHRATPDESVKLKACQGCGDVRYCGRECQRSDWSKGGHRTKCRRLK